jgi:tRNA(Ile)-lysidine synthase
MAEIGSVPVLAPPHDISQESFQTLLWRPLLNESPEAIERYVRHLGLTPVADESNDDLNLRRNVIRHRVLTLLEETVPGSVEALARYAALAAEDDALLADWCERAVADARRPDGALDGRSLIDQPLAMKRRMVRRWLEITVAAPPLTMSRTDAIIALASQNVGGKSVDIGEGWTVWLVGRMLYARLVSTGATERGNGDDES